MEPTIWLVCGVFGLGLGAMAWVLLTALQPSRSRALTNLSRGYGPATPSAPVEAGGGLQKLARRLTPAPLVALLEKQHARAGRPKAWQVGQLLALKMIWVPTALALIGFMAIGRVSTLLILIFMAVAVLVYFLPDLLLLSRGQERDTAVQRELADTLDQMTIAVEAGLGFDAALIRVASNGKGTLAEELNRTLQDMRIGLSRRQAFQDLAERNNVDDLRSFVRAVMQADAFGISIGDVLRTQAAEMRIKRRQRAEAQAQKVPVKVLFPLMLCILPVLFIIIMTPAVMSLVEAFSAVG